MRSGGGGRSSEKALPKDCHPEVPAAPKGAGRGGSSSGRGGLGRPDRREMPGLVQSLLNPIRTPKVSVEAGGGRANPSVPCALPGPAETVNPNGDKIQQQQSPQMPTESEVAGRSASPSATVPPAGPDSGRMASAVTPINPIQNHTQPFASDAPEVVGRPTCPSAVVPPSGPGVEVEAVMVNPTNPIGSGSVGSGAAGLAANPSVGCHSSGSDPLANSNPDNLYKEEDLITEDELNEFEDWTKGGFTSGLRNALVSDNPPIVSGTTQKSSSSSQPPLPSHGNGNEGASAHWGANVLHSLDKDQSRRKRKREHAKKAKAAKAAANSNTNPDEEPDPQTNDPEDDDGQGNPNPSKKSYKQATSEEEKPRGFALLQINATDNGADNQSVTIPKSRWLSFYGEFQSKLTEGWQQNPSLLLNAPKIHWVGWRSGRGQILTKDKESNDRLVEALDGQIIRIKGKECTLHVNFNNRELRPEGTWCGVFLPAYHLSPELEICKILAGSGFNGGTTAARTRARICSEIGRAHV